MEKSLHDFGSRLHLVERHGLAPLVCRHVDLEQAANGPGVSTLRVETLRKLGVGLGRVLPHCVLKFGNGVGRPQMRLAAHPVHVLATDIERGTQQRVGAESTRMTLGCLTGNFLQPDTFDGRRRAGEIFLHEIGLQAHRVENLGAAIGLIGRNAHLGHDLEYALADRLDVARHHLMGIDLRRESAGLVHIEQRVEGEIRVDRLCAEAGQAAEMMHFARLTGFHDQADGGAQALADQVMMNRRCRQKRRYRNAIGSELAVGQNDDVVAAGNRSLGALAQAIDGAGQPGRAFAAGISDVDCLGVETVLCVADRADLLQVAVCQDRLAHFEPLAPRGTDQIEDIRAGADERHQAHHQLFADRIDRRVRHLREVLLEIGVKQLRLVRHRRDRRVGTHRTNRLLAGRGHRRHQKLGVFLRVAEGLLAVEQRHVLPQRARFHGLQLFQNELGGLEPLLVRVLGRDFRLDLLVGNDAAFGRVDEQHAPWLETPACDDLLIRYRQHTCLGRHDHAVVVGHDVARGPQSVAVERSAYLAPIGEGNGGGAIPRLHQCGVIFIERGAFIAHQLVAGPRFRNEHHHRMGQRVAALRQKFERIVETRRIRLALVGDRPQLRNVIAEEFGIDRCLARRHPVDVAAQRVDLAIMRDHAIRVRKLPRWEGVGRKTLMDQNKRGLEARISEVLVIGSDLIGEEHALVDDGVRRHRHDIEAVVDTAGLGVNARRNHLAQNVKPALIFLVGGDRLAAADEDLTVNRLSGRNLGRFGKR
ncbi:MAG: hypothetical protein Rhirs2KO_05910 [Rhizobiaceae bacterium]